MSKSARVVKIKRSLRKNIASSDQVSLPYGSLELISFTACTLMEPFCFSVLGMARRGGRGGRRGEVFSYDQQQKSSFFHCLLCLVFCRNDTATGGRDGLN